MITHHPLRFLATRWSLGILVLLRLAAPAAATEHAQSVVIVVGAEGEAQFGRMFAAWANQWEAAARKAGAVVTRIGFEAEEQSDGPFSARDVLDGNGERKPGGEPDAGSEAKTDRELLERALAREITSSTDTLWLVLIGHGTFDGRTAKFNLRGPDVSAAEMAAWLKPHTRPQVVINCASSSSPFLNALSGPNRVVITATRSGNERNFARFGEYLAASIADPTADLDKDGQTSVLEAYLLASDLLAAFYSDESRLATEHPLLDDNGDGLGTPADWFRGTRAVKTAKDGAAPDGVRANQLCLIRSDQEQQLSPELRQQRDNLEFRLAVLRASKPKTDEAIYYQRLEDIIRQLAELYEQVP